MKEQGAKKKKHYLISISPTPSFPVLILGTTLRIYTPPSPRTVPVCVNVCGTATGQCQKTTILTMQLRWLTKCISWLLLGSRHLQLPPASLPDHPTVPTLPIPSLTSFPKDSSSSKLAKVITSPITGGVLTATNFCGASCNYQARARCQVEIRCCSCVCRVLLGCCKSGAKDFFFPSISILLDRFSRGKLWFLLEYF